MNHWENKTWPRLLSPGILSYVYLWPNQRLYVNANQMKIRRYFVCTSRFDRSVVSTPTHSHDVTQSSYGISLLMLPDEVVSYIDSFAKKAAAFFRISFFILSCLFSLRNRMSSSFSGLTFPGKACASSDISCFFHRLRTPW